MIKYKLARIEAEIPYKEFKSLFLPSYRKETFNEMIRFRRLENIFLE
jgi:hypothetical protein